MGVDHQIGGATLTAIASRGSPVGMTNGGCAGGDGGSSKRASQLCSGKGGGGVSQATVPTLKSVGSGALAAAAAGTPARRRDCLRTAYVLITCYVFLMCMQVRS